MTDRTGEIPDGNWLCGEALVDNVSLTSAVLLVHTPSGDLTDVHVPEVVLAGACAPRELRPGANCSCQITALGRRWQFTGLVIIAPQVAPGLVRVRATGALVACTEC
jgi:hypothetical protein